MAGIPVLLLFGPTASGKTRLLEDLFFGPFHLPQVEIISADSMQVYRGMNVGTAKPDPAFLERLPHHLIDIRNPDEQFNAGDFVSLADTACSVIAGRHALPVISGGTAFYFRNFMFGLPETPPADEETRKSVQDDLDRLGLESLRKELIAIDPESAERIHPNDSYRTARALEVARFSGRPLSSFRISMKLRPGYRYLALALDRERPELYERIDLRVDEMMRQGLRSEVTRLIEEGYSKTDPGMQAIGYREFFEAAPTGNDSETEIAAIIKKNTRHYAKRQITFFKTIPLVRWVHPENTETIAALISDFWLETDTGE